MATQYTNTPLPVRPCPNTSSPSWQSKHKWSRPSGKHKELNIRVYVQGTWCMMLLQATMHDAIAKFTAWAQLHPSHQHPPNSWKILGPGLGLQALHKLTREASSVSVFSCPSPSLPMTTGNHPLARISEGQTARDSRSYNRVDALLQTYKDPWEPSPRSTARHRSIKLLPFPNPSHIAHNKT